MNLRTVIFSAKLRFARFGTAQGAGSVANLAAVSLVISTPTLTCTSTAGVMQGAALVGPGIPANTTVLAITSATTLTMSQNASSNESSSTAVATNPGTVINLAAVSLTLSSPTLTCTSTTGVAQGAQIVGPGIPTGTTVLAVVDSTHLTLSANASSNESASVASAMNINGWPSAPVTGDPSLIQIGFSPSLSISPQGSYVEVKSPFQGIYAKRKSLPQITGCKISGPIQDYSPLAHESLFRLGAQAVVATPQQPFVQTSPITGWLEMQLYDHTQTLTQDGIVAVELSIGQYEVGEGKFGQGMMSDVIFNPLNSINLLALAADSY